MPCSAASPARSSRASSVAASASPVIAFVLEGPNAIAVVRSMVGATRPHEAAPGTIRGDYALVGLRNLVHASDSPETAVSEIRLWFPDGVVEYTRDRRTALAREPAGERLHAALRRRIGDHVRGRFVRVDRTHDGSALHVRQR